MEIAAEIWFWVGPKATGTARFGHEARRHGACIKGSYPTNPSGTCRSADGPVAVIALANRKGDAVRRSALASGASEVGTTRYGGERYGCNLPLVVRAWSNKQLAQRFARPWRRFDCSPRYRVFTIPPLHSAKIRFPLTSSAPGGLRCVSRANLQGCAVLKQLANPIHEHAHLRGKLPALRVHHGDREQLTSPIAEHLDQLP